MATKLDVEFRLDETLTIDTVVTDVYGSAVNISGYSGTDLQWGIASNQSSTRIATLQISAGVTILDGASGICRVSFGTTSQADLTPGRYYHELKATSTDGESIQVAGRARVHPSVFMSTSS